ncbi:ATP-binding protein [Radiobacillus kanasensis]|uniref:two-component system histidine kinase PnpS n=1 Tax=Radiobacillus kanasensis TaxID=2844358 RepID=UPI001E397AF5|nr:ATP-binding protein [Radiobacillus kanasensis]UFT98003.1 ATP-binding protein [Radiobacillus kanasensis]
MFEKNLRPFLLYIIVVVVVMVGMATVILPLITDYKKIIVIITLTGSAVVFFVLMYHIYDKYIKPVRSAAQVAEQLVNGNYKARTYETFFGDAGKLTTAVNILARSLQEMSLQEKMQENQLRTVIDHMESGLLLIDDKGYVHLVNRKFLSIFGGEKQDYFGYLYYEVLKQEVVHRVVQEAFLYEEMVKNSFTTAIEIEQKYIEIVGAPVVHETNELRGVVLVFHDITELKKLEQMRKDFVANVSHELKTPITSIRGFAETLLDGAMDSDELRSQFLSIILKESERLQILIHDLLELSKLDKVDLKLQRETVDVKQLVEEILPIADQQAKDKEIELSLSFDDDTVIQGDSDRLKQVFINLINNAISYTPVGGSVQVLVENRNDVLDFSVKDTGIGIPEEAIPRIFERFYRVDKARSRNTGGTGLGLAIVKHIVELHEGKIYVDSVHEKGTTFRISFPKHI